MPKHRDRFLTAQPHLDRRRGRYLLPKQSELLEQTAQRRKDAGALYDARIFRPKREDVVSG